VQLTTSLQPVDFARDDYDVAIRVGDRLDAQPGLAAVKLVDVGLIPVCSLEIGESLNRPFNLTGATLLHNAPRFVSLNLSIQAAIGGVGVGIAIQALVEEELASGRFIQPFEPSRLSSRPFYLTYPFHHARDKRLAVFAKWLNAEAASTEIPGELGI